LENLYLRLSAIYLRLGELGERSDGFTTAELLGNAALAIVALIAIWTALRLLGVHIIADITNKLSQF
jgi:hypothetical protein